MLLKVDLREFNIGVCAKDLQGDLGENLTWLSENGFKSFQVWQQQIEFIGMRPSELLQRCLDMGLRVSAVGGGPNLVDPVQSVNSVQQFKAFVDLSLELECGIVSAETKMLPPNLTHEDGWALCVENISEICDYAKANGAVLAIECAGPCFIKDHLDWWELKRRVPSSALKVNFDAANIAWGRQNPLQACHSLLPEIVHTHIKDISYLPQMNQMENEENQDCILGEGIVEYTTILEALLEAGYRGPFCIEMHSGHLDRRDDVIKSKLALERQLSTLLKQGVYE